MLHPWVPCTKDDGDCTCIPEEKVVGTRPYHVSISSEELVRDDVLFATEALLEGPKAGYTCQKRTGKAS
jgi:hypothetical protein